MKSYSAVRIVAVILKIAGIISIIGGIFAIVGVAMMRTPLSNAWSWFYAVLPVFAGIGYIGAGQLLDLFVDIAHDVRFLRRDRAEDVAVIERERRVA